MLRRRRRVPLPVDAFDTSDLRWAADHLTGWTYSRVNSKSDLPTPSGLLFDAAAEIDRLQKILLTWPADGAKG